jgi:uncharacterized protein YuzE
MKNILITVALFATGALIAQEELAEVVVKAANYRYLNAVDNTEVPAPIRNLQEEVASYDTTGKELYVDEDQTYNAAFEIPEGKILVAYDEHGNILKTVERFRNIRLPKDVRNTLADRYIGWSVVKDLYLINYSQELGAKKVYDIKLKNNNETVRVKLDENGKVLE